MAHNSGWNLENSYSRLPAPFFSTMEADPADDPALVMFNEPLAKELGLDVQELQTEAGAAIFTGNTFPDGAVPLAQAYAGHQFGQFTMLGDGRALLIGEQITPGGERVDIQLKGSGPTPYSRRGDGRAALGPMLREYIISEAMHGLGIPTTRSLAVAATGEATIRETALPGAVLTRVAASHLRVGTFQYAANWTAAENLQALADYAIERHYPEIEENGEQRYLSFLEEVIKRQAALIAKWQLAGFIHGVMNTDNMTISGETIDYGPCAFMDTYKRETVFSSIDVQGRYAYGNQPGIGGWNLARFAESLLPLLHEDQEEAVKLAQETISRYPELYRKQWLEGMRAKVGLVHEEKEDEALLQDLLSLMEKHEADYTNTFRSLTIDQLDGQELFQSDEFSDWRGRWQERLEKQEASIKSARELMRQSNPAVIPRNHRVEEALEAAGKGDFSLVEQLLAILSEPYAYSADQEEYTKPPGPSGCDYRTYCGT
ncbi:protein adenylyltransferase SelO [Metabacillus sp. 84]|uniref:protein adenylyltransferase SelO n=1 Tax=unclassified Metabacillus TaxID=2675274 RepID=UPI003CFB4E36